MTRFPSVDRIEAVTGCDRETAIAVRRILDGRDSVDTVLGDSDPYVNSASLKMDAVNLLLEHHGVEGITGDGWHRYWMDLAAVYTNSGDTYSGCILYDVERATFYATTWGDWVETAENNGRYHFA